jgi:CheY-like chemotaxis protein
MKILYVENHAVFAAQVISKFLSNHDITLVPSLAEARQALSKADFNLVLVDFDLDDGKGDELVCEIRAVQPKLPIIGVSSHEPGNQAMLKAGANAVCSKMDFDQIQPIIQNVLRTA